MLIATDLKCRLFFNQICSIFCLLGKSSSHIFWFCFALYSSLSPKNFPPTLDSCILVNCDFFHYQHKLNHLYMCNFISDKYVTFICISDIVISL